MTILEILLSCFFNLNNMINLQRYLDMLSSLNGNLIKQENYLIVDGTNTFMRSAAANPSMNETGQVIGALSGFLLSVGFAIKTLKISNVLIVFDGKNTKKTRTDIYPLYKANRTKLKKISRNELITTIEEDTEALKWQMTKLINYLQLLPVKIILADYFEADDIIAYVANNYLKDKSCYIMSSDKDFYQLINTNIKVWSPTKKRIITESTIREDFLMESYNFVLYKILLGDSSDNIPGVPGLGPKTLLKYFSFLQESTIFNIDDIFKYCEIKIKENTKYGIYQKVLDFKDQLLINEKLIQLQDIQMNNHVKMIIDNSISKEAYRLNKLQLIKSMLEDQIVMAFKDPTKWIKECWVAIDCALIKE